MRNDEGVDWSRARENGDRRKSMTIENEKSGFVNLSQNNSSAQEFIQCEHTPRQENVLLGVSARYTS